MNRADTPGNRILLHLDGQPVEVHFVSHPRARFYRITFRRDGSFRCTIPSRGNRAGAEEFVRRQAVWIRGRIAARANRPSTPRQWALGTSVWLHGQALDVVHAQDGPFLEVGPLRIPQPAPGESDLRPRIERRLRALATQELPARTLELAALHGFQVRSIQVRDQRSRWGSCSARKVISLNWRLVQFPPEIADYVILHELAHLRHLNHSAAFWAEVARLYPDHEAAEKWLKTHGERHL